MSYHEYLWNERPSIAATVAAAALAVVTGKLLSDADFVSSKCHH